MATVGDALDLAARGFRVFPLRENDWRPKIKGWVDAATVDPDQIRRWWAQWPKANVGVATGKGLVVIDIDNKKGKNGSASFAALDLPAESLDTFTVETPSGGRHVYFKGPDVTNSRDDLGSGLDVRTAGGYVVGPGSTLTDGVKEGQPGGVYLPSMGRPDCLQPAPDALTSRLLAATDRDRPRGLNNLDVSIPGALARAEDYLDEKAEAALRGEDRGTFQTALFLRDIGVDEETALDLIEERWNPHRSPPRDHDRLAFKVANAYRYGENPPGSKSPETQFAGVVIPPLPAPIPRKPSKFFRHGETFNKNASWLYYEIAPRTGVCVLVGETAAGKTFLEIEMARCGATGKPFFKTVADEPYGTIFVFAGTEGSGLARRFAALQEATALPISAMTVGDLRRPGALSELLEDLKGECAYIEMMFGVRVGCVVLETLAASGLLPRENDAGEASMAMHNLATISHELGVLVVTSHHPAKGTNESRGSGAVPAAADYVLSIRRSGRDKVRQVELVKARDAEQRSLGSFSLVPVDLGADEKGRPITSMTVSMGEPESKAMKESKHSELVMECIDWALMENAKTVEGKSAVDKNEAWGVFQERCKTPTDRSNQHKAWQTALKFIEDQGAIELLTSGAKTYIHRKEIFI
jgi:bifunctional DNA primase/polymerase-like protein/AAA domain-containing protein